MNQEKQRVIQEYVPGKQVTLAHLIAHPQKDIYTKLGLNGDDINAIGIMTITPAEASIIAADVATKAAGVNVGFLDRFTGCLVVSGDVSSVEEGLTAVLELLVSMGFAPSKLTRS